MIDHHDALLLGEVAPNGLPTWRLILAGRIKSNHITGTPWYTSADYD